MYLKKAAKLTASSLFLLFFGLVLNVWAGLRIDNAKIMLDIKPGSYDSGEIKVENATPGSMNVKVYLEDWVYSDYNGGKTFMPKGTNALSCSNWITFFPADFTLAANESKIVRYTVAVPEDAKGGHFSVMFFETGGDEIEQPNVDGTTVRIKVLNRLGSLFYVDAAGTAEKTAELSNLNVMQKLNDFIVSADFQNTGNTYIAAKGTFNVIDNQGIVYVRGEFNEVYTLPKDKAYFKSISSSKSLKPGTYDLIITLDFQGGGSLVQEAQLSVSSVGEVSVSPLKK